MLHRVCTCQLYYLVNVSTLYRNGTFYMEVLGVHERENVLIYDMCLTSKKAVESIRSLGLYR